MTIVWVISELSIGFRIFIRHIKVYFHILQLNVNCYHYLLFVSYFSIIATGLDMCMVTGQLSHYFVMNNGITE